MKRHTYRVVSIEKDSIDIDADYYTFDEHGNMIFMNYKENNQYADPCFIFAKGAWMYVVVVQ